MVTISKKVETRFKSFIKIVGNCNIWQGFLDKDGYGTFYFFKRSRRAHRFAYYMANGDIPPGMVVDHICRKRSCVNPEHLQLVTPRQNSLENSLSVGAINARKILCKRGHPFDKKYGSQRYCTICQSEKAKRLRKKWYDAAIAVKC